MQIFLPFALLIVLITGVPGCDAASGALGGGTGTDGGDDGPYSICLYSYAGDEAASDFGQGCTADTDCAHGTCMMPGDSGNITNDVFGFCTRACHCEAGGVAALMESSDPDYSCVYPGGCYVGQSQGAWRHAAPKCSSVSDCTDIDSRYTDCATTNSTTVVEDTCGSITKVCQAHAE